MASAMFGEIDAVAGERCVKGRNASLAVEQESISAGRRRDSQRGLIPDAILHAPRLISRFSIMSVGCRTRFGESF